MKKLVGALLVCCLELGGCGEGDGEGESKEVERAAACNLAPCGGEIEGEWAYDGYCDSTALVAEALKSCDTATADTRKVTLTGSFDFAADGSYFSSRTIDGKAKVEFPSECTEQQGTTLNCELFGSLLTTLLATETANGISTVACIGSDLCKCEIHFSGEAVEEEGTYATADEAITLTNSDGEQAEGDFCVSGKAAVLTLDEGNGAYQVALTR